MRKRVWEVEWVARPKSDGSERLSQAVKLVIDHAVGAREVRSTPAQAHRCEGQEEVER